MTSSGELGGKGPEDHQSEPQHSRKLGENNESRNNRIIVGIPDAGADNDEPSTPSEPAAVEWYPSYDERLTAAVHVASAKSWVHEYHALLQRDTCSAAIVHKRMLKWK
jgi:hypothetical protein